MKDDDVYRTFKLMRNRLENVMEDLGKLLKAFDTLYCFVNNLPSEKKQKIMRYLNRTGTEHVAVLWTPEGFEEWGVKWEYDPYLDKILITSHDAVEVEGVVVTFEPRDIDRWTALKMFWELLDAVIRVEEDER